jgi:nucleotide sugar dehydrogenase
MHISIVGSGYVGATLAGCLADLGHDITAIDIDAEVVEQINAGTPPIVEPGLESLFEEHVGERIRATTEVESISDTDVTFLTVQTPSSGDGMIDTKTLESACRDVGGALADKTAYHLVVVKSTVLPGIAEELLGPAIAEASGPDQDAEIGLAVNPEFQAQGSAVEDFMEPDKLVFGTDDEQAQQLLSKVYAPLIAQADPPVVQTGRREASMIKYANNVFLAAKVSLINELGNIGKEYGVDSYAVADAMGLDERIGARFLRSGAGWGGSCLPGDQRLFVGDQPEMGLTFEAFFDRYVEESVVSDVSVLSSDLHGNFSYKPVQGATRREYDGLLHSFEFGSAEPVTVTSDHPMIVVKRGVPTVVEAAEVTTGDDLPVIDGVPAPPVTEHSRSGFESLPAGERPVAEAPQTTAHVTARAISEGRPTGTISSHAEYNGSISSPVAGVTLAGSPLECGAEPTDANWNRSAIGGRPSHGAGVERGRARGAVPESNRADRFRTATVRDVSTERASAEVYSIEVADNHTFVTTGGVLVHNCFPKDTAALMAAAREKGYDPDLLGEVVGVNDRQPLRMVELLQRHTEIAGSRIAVLGAAFKPGTDDTRGSRARPLVEALSERGARPVVYDPTDAAEVIAGETERAQVAESARSALEGAGGALVVTGWDEFGALDSEFDLMAEPVVVDGRRIVRRREGIVYEGLTW